MLRTGEGSEARHGTRPRAVLSCVEHSPRGSSLAGSAPPDDSDDKADHLERNEKPEQDKAPGLANMRDW